MANIHDFELTGIDGSTMSLEQFKGQVVLLVNVASACGLTPQYEGLQALYEQYSGDGFTIIGLPCNQFGAQEPGTEAEIQTFCTTKFSVTFPMSAKIEVNGDSRHPLYEYLAGKDGKFPGDITWNFEKFLVNRNGDAIERFEPVVNPGDDALTSAIEAELAK